MSYIYPDSADNTDDDLKDLIEEFLDEELDDDFEKARAKMPKELVDGLREAFKIMNKHKDYLDEDLKNAMQYISRILTKYPEPGKLPIKYPYPLKKSGAPILWSDMLEQMFPDSPDEDDDEFEKADEAPTKEKPWPTFAKEFKKNAREIKKNQDILERHFFNPYDRAV